MFKNQVNKVPIWITIEEANKYLQYYDDKKLRKALKKQEEDGALRSSLKKDENGVI